jgi:hypothetical protein
MKAHNKALNFNQVSLRNHQMRKEATAIANVTHNPGKSDFILSTAEGGLA